MSYVDSNGGVAKIVSAVINGRAYFVKSYRSATGEVSLWYQDASGLDRPSHDRAWCVRSDWATAEWRGVAQ